MRQEQLSASAGKIEQIVVSVFEKMMGLEAESVQVPWYPMPNRLTASIQFAGVRSGALVLETDEPHARKFAARLLGIECPEAVDDDVRDAMGELANIIAGNSKAILAPGATLSMPFVVDGGDFQYRICRGTEVEQYAFSVNGCPIWISWIFNCSCHPDRETFASRANAGASDGSKE